MDMSGDYKIAASRQEVWEALNDPEILKASIAGCESLEQVGENELEAKVTAKVGPVKAKFQGKVTLENLNPPASYSIKGEGKGGAAGFAKGGADVSLEEEEDGTRLRYEAKADVGGKLAQIGSRLIQGAAKKMADDFFQKFAALVEARHAQAAAPQAAAPLESAAAPAAAATEAPAGAAPASSGASEAASSPVESALAASEAAAKDDVASEDKGANPVIWVAAGVAVLVIAYLLLG